MDCPICGFQVADPRGIASHFRHQASTHPDYSQWQEDQRFNGLIEGVDYVRCLLCGQRAETLARHLKASHGITADEYRVKFPDALIRPAKLTEKRQEASRNRKGGFGKGELKDITCPECGAVWQGSKFLVPGTHDMRCPACQQRAEEDRWVGKTEPEDYVTCLECGHRAENLTSHIQNAHPGYRDRYPEALVVALSSSVRDKTALQGRVLSAETRQKMSENAGRWNKGQTKETNPSLARASEKMLGKPGWNQGLTAETDTRVAEAARKLQMYVGENRPWDNGLAANLTLGDFQPFLDSEGRVDTPKVVAATGVSWHTVRKYITDLSLAVTRRYVEEAADDRTIRLDLEVLEKFKLGNGKVSIGKAMSVLGHAFGTIKRECDRHGLPTFHRHIRQTLCLDAVSKVLGEEPYEQEWMSRRFVNPLTGNKHMFKFDGFFEGLKLIVEFHGNQHYIFPNAYMVDESYLPVYEAMRERDRLKKKLIEESGDLFYFAVREDEPFTDKDYLRGRLMMLGLLEVRPGGLWFKDRCVWSSIR